MTKLMRLFAGLLVIVCLQATIRADSAMDLLSGFDQERIETAYPPSEDASLGELAKLIYRLQSVTEASLKARLGDGEAQQLGDAVKLQGELTRVRRVPIPESLVEFLEFTHVFVVDLKDEDGDARRIVASDFPADAQAGDQVSGLGVAIEMSGSGGWSVMAAPQVKWIPRSTSKVGWRMLGEVGFEVALLSETQQRSRQPLLAEDGDAFYSLMAAARQVGTLADNPAPARPRAVELLEKSEALIGDWMALTMETVQITRIAVTEPNRQNQLGQDYYYQIDAVVDLGDVVVKIKPREGSDAAPAIFENRYPVSVVATEIPDFLKQRIRVQEGGEAVVSQHRSLIGVDGFFFRLWSYQSEFMNQRGGGDQFGPLIVATTITDLSKMADDPAGVQIIGWIAAAAVIVGILFFWLWSRTMDARDRHAKRRRQEREAEHVQLPGV